jgi:hypothetical protein
MRSSNTKTTINTTTIATTLSRLQCLLSRSRLEEGGL